MKMFSQKGEASEDGGGGDKVTSQKTIKPLWLSSEGGDSGCDASATFCTHPFLSILEALVV